MFFHARGVIGLVILTCLFAARPAAAISDQEELVQKANITVQKVLQNGEIGPTVATLLKRAKGVMVFPAIYKGAFFIGAEGGSGVMLAKGSSGGWSYPAFYFLGSGSFGLQIGAQTAEMVLLIMTERGLTAVLNQKVKLGADVNAAIGPFGIGGEAATTINFGADILTYSLNQGVFAGFSIEGAVIYPREEWNTEYYGDLNAKPESVIIQGKFRNTHADPLRTTLAR